jgi:hypothetical protein
MPESTANTPRRARPALLASAIAAATVLAGLAATAGAERAVVLGKTDRTPPPSCPSKPASPCTVSGQVTGFQRVAAGEKGLFRLDQAGRIVAWSVSLGRPDKEERNAFGELAQTEKHGGAPTAGIGILRKESRERYTLKRRSPVVKVGRYYGEKPVITLNDPLRVRAGDIVALTTATWLPNYASGLGQGNVWVASRKPDECNAEDFTPEEFFERTSPHLKEGSTRRYGCEYRGQRILYWAWLAPRRGDGGGGGGEG